MKHSVGPRLLCIGCLQCSALSCSQKQGVLCSQWWSSNGKQCKLQIPLGVLQARGPDTQVNISTGRDLMVLTPPWSTVIAVFQSLIWVQFFATPWTAACQASLSFSISQSLLTLMSIESVMPSNHLCPLSSPSPPAFNLSQHQSLF